MPIHHYKYFSPADAAQVGRLHFMARQVVEGVITGLHKSPHRGFSVEFSEHREYVPGDELRHMDWKAYARVDRHYIKLYEQETNLRATLVLDNSASMKFGNKIDYARHLTACIAYLLSTQQDLAGFVAADESIRVELPAGSTPQHLNRLFLELERVQVGRGTELPKHLHELAERLPRRSLVIILSDLWTDRDALARALQHLRYRKHEGLMLHLLDKAEIDLPYEKDVTLEDLETGEKMQVDPAELREAYRKNVEDHLTALRKICSDCDVEYHALKVEAPYARALVELLGKRAIWFMGHLQFLFPAALLALPLVGLPVVLHLLFRRKAPIVQFSTLQFIKASIRQTAARRKVRRWMLLACRMLLLLLLIWALAQPVRRLFASWAGKSSVAAAIVVDTSYSMQLRDHGTTLLSQADDAVKQLLRQDLSDGRVAIFRSLPNPAHEGFNSASEILTEWSNLQPQPSPGALVDRVAAAEAALQQRTEDHKWLFVLTDLQDREFPRQITDFPDGRAILMDLHPPDVCAAGISDVQIEPKQARLGVGGQIDVEVTGKPNDSLAVGACQHFPSG